MQIITRILMPNMISIGLKAWKLLRYHCSYHGNLVTIATRYDDNAHCPKEALY